MAEKANTITIRMDDRHVARDLTLDQQIALTEIVEEFNAAVGAKQLRLFKALLAYFVYVGTGYLTPEEGFKVIGQMSAGSVVDALRDFEALLAERKATEGRDNGDGPVPPPPAKPSSAPSEG